MNWILYGFKNSGKSYFAARLGLPYIDTDQMVEKKMGLSVREIVLTKGEKFFRKIEEEVISSIDIQGSIIAIGGRSVLNKANLNYLKHLGKFIYLRAPKELLKKRLLTPPLPTFLNKNDLSGSFEKMYYERIPEYEKIDATWIHLEDKTTEQILEEIWQVINLDKSFGSQLGENPTEKQLESSSTDALQGSILPKKKST